MNIFNEFLNIFIVITILYGLAAIIIVLWLILKRQDEKYKEKYKEFLAQKIRVLKKLEERGKENGI